LKLEHWLAGYTKHKGTHGACSEKFAVLLKSRHDALNRKLQGHKEDVGKILKSGVGRE